MPAHPDADLLSPVLREEDDVRFLGQPRDPMSLLLVTLFLGLPAGGPLPVLNLRRPGFPGKARVGSLLLLAGMVMVANWSLWLRAELLPHPGGTGARRATGPAVRLIEYHLALPLALAPGAWFEIYRRGGSQPAGVFPIRQVAAALGIAANLLIVSGLRLLHGDAAAEALR